MKMNSTYKMIWKLVLLIVGLLGFAVSGVGQTYEIIDYAGDDYIVSSFVQNLDGCSYYKVKNTSQNNDKAFRVKKDGSFMTADAGHDPNWLWKSENWGGRVYVISAGRTVYVKLCDNNVSISLKRPSELPFSSAPWKLEARNNCATFGEFEKCGDTKYKFLLKASDQNNQVQFNITQEGDDYTKDCFTTYTIQENWGQYWYFDASASNVNPGVWVIMDITSTTKTLTYQSGDNEPNCGNSVTSATAYVNSTGSSSACLSSNPQLTSTYVVGSGSFTPLYQWYKDGSPISDERNSTYTPNSIGSYTVKVYAGDYSDSNPATSNVVSITGPTVTTVTLSSDNSVYCSSGTNLTVDDNAACCPSGYPQYAWYNKDGVLVETTTSSTYPVSSSGSWKVIVYASADVFKESSIVVIDSENPTLSLNQSSLSFENLLDNPIASAQQIIPSVEGACKTYTYSYTSTNANFSVDASGNVTFNNNTGTSGIYNGTIEVTATPEGGGSTLTATVNVSGTLRDCVPAAVVSGGNMESGLPNWIHPTSSNDFSSSNDQNITNNNNDFYRVAATKVGTNIGDFESTDGNVFHTFSKSADCTVFTIQNSDNVSDDKRYVISFSVGNNSADWQDLDGDVNNPATPRGAAMAKYGVYDQNGMAVSVGSTELGFLEKGTKGNYSIVVSGADLKSGVAVNLHITGRSNGKTSAYFDNIQIESTCPPKIEITDDSDICSSTPSITASVIKGSAEIDRYEWYIKGVSDLDFSLLASHTSASITDSYSSLSEIASGSIIKAIVYDKNGSKAETLDEVSCGPIIDPINEIETICVLGDITDLAVPSYTSSSTISSEGWEVASSPTAVGSEWSTISLNDVPSTYKNYYIRYFAVNEQGKGKSNAVQITMFDAPVVSPISVGDICVGNAFDLTAPNVNYNANEVSEEWQYATQADFSDATAFTSSDTFDDEGTYYIRYAATDVCTTSYATTTANVNDPSLSVTEYPTYMRVAGTEQVVASAPVLDATCVGTLTYSITDGNGAGYFAIDENTGVITMTPAATTTGDFPITVTITDGVNTVIEDLTISLTEEPTLSLQCSGATDYYVYTKYQKLNLQNIVTSRYVNEDVALTLSGSAASYFSLSPTSVTKNTNNIPVSINQNDYFTGVGDYTLKLTATTEGLTEECNVTIHVKNLDITDYVEDQTNCSSDAPSLMVEVTGEDATNLPLSFQWYKDGIAIPGATSKTFKPTVDGKYYCTVSTGATLLHTSKTATVFFVKNMPVLSFDEEAMPIPSEVFCSQEVAVVMKVTLSGVDVTDKYSRYWWQNGGEGEGLTATGEHTYTFDCDDDDYTTTIGAYIMENTTGCAIPVTKSVTVKAMSKIYSYYGPTGDASDVTDRENWFSCKNSSGEVLLNVNPVNASEVAIPMQEGTFYNLYDPQNHKKEEVTCSMPPESGAFAENGAQYIINKDGVKLKSDQTWNVSGKGTKVVVGDGNWTSSFTSIGGGWSREGMNSGFGIPNSYAEKQTVGGTARVEQLSAVANHDYRACAKEFDIVGELNLSSGVKLDVQNGSSLIIETDKGNFELGELATDKITYENVDKLSNIAYNLTMKPGSSVTYKSDGTKKIRKGVYSQLYIEPTNSSDSIVFDNEAEIVVHQVLELGENATFANVNPNESLITYDGSVNQTIASMPYYVLNLQSATDKTLDGRIDVASSFVIGTGVVCKAGDNVVNINGSGANALVYDGKQFDCGTSTVNFNASANTTVPAMTYYNLNLGDGDRTLFNKNIIGIAGTFQADEDATYLVDGSTVEFNGTGSVTQHIPEFTFYNLVMNSTALSNNTDNSFNDAYFVIMDGDVNIKNQIVLTKGVLKTGDNKLKIDNTASEAVGQGYHESTKNASFVYGDMTRVLPQSSSNDGLYYFSVGDQNGYKPFMISQASTTGESVVTVGLSDGMSGSFADALGESTVSTSYSWKLSTDANYVDGRVAVSTSSGLNNANAVVYGQAMTGTFENIFGSAVGNSIMYTQRKGAGYYALTTRNATEKTYYYNCSGSVDASLVGAWYTEENGSGTVATNFDEPDAEWIIKCGTTITGDLSIMGANSKVTLDIPSGQSLNLKSPVEFITAVHKQGSIEIDSKGELKVDYGFVMKDDASAANRAKIVNNGRLDLRNADITLKNTIIENNGFLYSENVNWTVTSDENQFVKDIAANPQNFKHTMFINNGKVQMVNANFDVPRGKGGDGNLVHIRNADGAMWLIDNITSSGAKHINFNGANFVHADVGKGVAYVDFQCGSSFIVKKTDVKMIYSSADLVQKIGGEIVVEDGNLFITRYGSTGGDFTLEQTCGAIYLNDTDKSGDGILQLQGGGGGYEMNIEGTMYVMGMVEQGGSGAEFNVKNGSKVFIGNIGALMPAYSWQFKIDVEKGGALYYCGNRSSGPDNVGTNEGYLYYAGSYYYHSDPIKENDFTVSNPGEYALMFVDEEDCMEAYYEGIPPTDKGSLLPIELTMLYGVCDDNDVILRWQTASETNSSHFVILRSFNGIDFEEVDIIGGAGTTTSFHNYDYVDSDVEKQGIVYYKLRQVDYDGNYTDSKVIAVQTCGKNAHFSFYADEIDISFANPEQSNYVIITSITGQIFYSKSFRNVEEARIAAPQRKGIYIISVIDNKQITSEKFIR